VAADEVESKLFIGLLASSLEALDKAKGELKTRYGPIDLESAAFPFHHTTYYNEEMGNAIIRQFVSFDNLFDPGKLREVKRETIEIERKLSIGGKRIANLDPGYLNLSTAVLATTKDAAYRVYLGDGIYAQATLFYRKGGYVPFEWTYSDYREEESLRFFGEVRQRFKTERREKGSQKLSA
jgi:hypothetical protein